MDEAMNQPVPERPISDTQARTRLKGAEAILEAAADLFGVLTHEPDLYHTPNVLGDPVFVEALGQVVASATQSLAMARTQVELAGTTPTIAEALAVYQRHTAGAAEHAQELCQSKSSDAYLNS